MGKVNHITNQGNVKEQSTPHTPMMRGDVSPFFQ